METILKKLIENTSPKSTREIIEDHVKMVKLTGSNEIVITVDRKYAFNILHSQEHIGNLISGIKKAFGNDKKTVLKLKPHLLKGEYSEHHDREMNIPYMIHYK